MKAIIGEYECRLDAKGRVALPAALLRQLSPEDKARFIISRGIERHLTLYVGSEWDRMLEKLMALNDFVIKERHFMRRFFSGASELNLDSHHRLLLPKRLLGYAEIDDALIFSARPNHLANKIEVWQPQRYEALFSDDENDFAQLAQDVMGNKLVIPLDQE